MTDEQMSPEDQEELQQTARLVAQTLAEGKSPADVTKQLVDNGWDEDAAEQFVSAIALRLVEAQHSAGQSNEGSGGMGWLIWIGLILFINLLSYLFGWSFWIY